MHKFKALEPVRLQARPKNLVGRLPSDLHLRVLRVLPLFALPAYARCSHATAALAHDESLWHARWTALAVDTHGFSTVLDDIESFRAASKAAAPATISVDDDFGDFATVDLVQPRPDELGDFIGAFDTLAVVSPPPTAKDTFRAKYIRAHNLLKPLLRHLSVPAHLILSELAANVPPSIRAQAKLLHLLSLFLSDKIKPVARYDVLSLALRSAMDRFDANLLAAFDIADGNGDEDGMKEAAESSWNLRNYDDKDWEMGKVWADKREIFYQHGWKPLDNITCEFHRVSSPFRYSYSW